MKRLLFILVIAASFMIVTISFSEIDKDCDKASLLIDYSSNVSVNKVINLPYTKEEFEIFTLPSSVQIIEDEAFEGTSIISIQLPESVKTIGEYAFANISSLRIIRIPNTTQIIASNAFEGSNYVTINSTPDSYARKYAKARGLPFVPVMAVTASLSESGHVNLNTEGRKNDAIDTDPSDELKTSVQRKQTEENNVTPIIDYLGKLILSRGPPMG